MCDVMSCLFCRIVERDIPATLVADAPRTMAFRDINPTAPTHVLVIPKEHIDHAGVVGAQHGEVMAEMLLTAQEVARIDGLTERGYRLVFNVGEDSGNSVPHLHLHVIGGRAMGWPPFANA